MTMRRDNLLVILHRWIDSVASTCFAGGWRVLLYFLLILLCMLYAPEESQKFIYTEF